MRAILMFHNCDGLSHKTVSTDHNFRGERRAEADSNRGPSAYQPNALPLGQTGSLNSVQPCTYIEAHGTTPLNSLNVKAEHSNAMHRDTAREKRCV